MINANELRIGNWIFDEHGNPIQFYCMESRDEFMWREKFSSASIDIRKCNPIPLTEEWLLKLGFEKLKGNVFNKIGVIAFYNGEWWTIDSRKRIDWVHRLQNYFYEVKDEELTMKEPVKHS